jgi:TPR repeat protein
VTRNSIPKDDVEAAKWYGLSAGRGNAAAQYNLALMYENGAGILKDDAEALKWLRKAADQGYGLAQCNLGVLYQNGTGVSKDYTEAVNWYRKAADQGNPEAQYDLGFMYATGLGVPRDNAEAAKWYRNAADQGVALAEGNLAFMYENGAGVPKDDAEAVKWYRKAADQGNAVCQYDLGLMYANGNGVPKDNAEAANWLRKAAEQGNSDAQFQLGYLYDSLFKNIYLNGQTDNGGLPFDDAEAFKWYLKAAKQGNVSAQFYLGAKYSFGKGVLQDDTEAIAWLNIAAAAGNIQAASAKFNLELKDGSAVALAGQKRSKEIIDEIEAARKQPPGSAPYSSNPAGLTDAPPKASGSGAIVSRSGIVLTAAHVIAGANSLKVYTAHGLQSAKVLRIDEANDIAVLQLVAGTYTALTVVSSHRVRLGQTVATIGFPNIEIQGFSPKVTRGEISSLNGVGDDPRSWQISVPVQPGNSGGPLLDENGDLVGIVESKLGIEAAKATNDIPQNVGYAVKSAYVLPLLEPYLGDSAPQPDFSPISPRFEDMVDKAEQSVVLILVY